MARELSQFENYLVHEFVEDYVDGIMSRRDMMSRVLHITGGVATTATILTQLGVKPAAAQEATPAPRPTPTEAQSSVAVPEDDPGISASDVTFPGADGDDIMAYQVMPAEGDGPFPVVLICHENRGLTEHIRDGHGPRVEGGGLDADGPLGARRRSRRPEGERADEAHGDPAPGASPSSHRPEAIISDRDGFRMSGRTAGCLGSDRAGHPRLDAAGVAGHPAHGHVHPVAGPGPLLFRLAAPEAVLPVVTGPVAAGVEHRAGQAELAGLGLPAGAGLGALPGRSEEDVGLAGAQRR